MLRVVSRLPATLVPLAAQVRWQSTGGSKESAPQPPAQPQQEAKPKDVAPPAESQASGTGAAAAAKSSECGDYRFPTTEVIDAVKKRDFNAVQTHATRLVQRQWKESYNVPAACIVVFVVVWYWIAWSRRSIRRKCEALKASTRQQTEEMVEVVRSMTEKWKGEMAKANQQMQGIIDKNSELTRDIDRLTTALRSCSVRPTPASASAAPTVQVVKRTSSNAAPAAAAVAVDAPAEATEEATAAAASPADTAESEE